MIPFDFITEWRATAPWISDVQVEQDLIITRAVVEIFNVEEVASALAFRGGTALYKLHPRPKLESTTTSMRLCQSCRVCLKGGCGATGRLGTARRRARPRALRREKWRRGRPFGVFWVALWYVVH